MNVVVADACPVICLAKLNRLALIRSVFSRAIVLPSGVERELTQTGIPIPEQRRIQEFLKHCRIESVRHPRFPAAGLSVSDRQVLTLAAKYPKGVVILTDDRLVRRIALTEGHAVAGTLGVVIRAVRASLMTHTEALRAVDELVMRHHLRVSVELYQETLRQLGPSA